MKFKFSVSGKDTVHKCCNQEKVSSDLTHSRITVQCSKQKLHSAPVARAKQAWVPVSPQHPVINSNTCYYNPDAYHLEARDELLTWMLHVSYKLRFGLKTYHLAVHVLDGLLSVYDVEVENVKLVTYIALHLAAKMEESTEKVPGLHSVAELFNYEFTVEKLRSAEMMIFSIFGFGIHKRTILVELEEILHNGVLFCSDIYSNMNLDFVLRRLNDFFTAARTDLILDYELSKFRPQIVASSLLYISRTSVGLAPWTDHLTSLNDVTQEDMRECISFMLNKYFSNLKVDKNVNHKTQTVDELEEEIECQSQDASKENNTGKNDLRKISMSSIYTTDSALNFPSFN